MKVAEAREFWLRVAVEGNTPGVRELLASFERDLDAVGTLSDASGHLSVQEVTEEYFILSLRLGVGDLGTVRLRGSRLKEVAFRKLHEDAVWGSLYVDLARLVVSELLLAGQYLAASVTIREMGDLLTSSLGHEFVTEKLSAVFKELQAILREQDLNGLSTDLLQYAICPYKQSPRGWSDDPSTTEREYTLGSVNLDLEEMVERLGELRHRCLQQVKAGDFRDLADSYRLMLELLATWRSRYPGLVMLSALEAVARKRLTTYLSWDARFDEVIANGTESKLHFAVPEELPAAEELALIRTDFTVQCAKVSLGDLEDAEGEYSRLRDRTIANMKRAEPSLNSVALLADVLSELANAQREHHFLRAMSNWILGSELFQIMELPDNLLSPRSLQLRELERRRWMAQRVSWWFYKRRARRQLKRAGLASLWGVVEKRRLAGLQV